MESFATQQDMQRDNIPPTANHPRNATSLELRVSALERMGDRIAALEKQIPRLTACTEPPPFEKGQSYFGGDDRVYASTVQDDTVGKVFWFRKTDELARVAKNLTRRILDPGEEFEGGFVDRKLRHPVRPNDLFWVDLP
jgi:hypothetical protein